MPTSWWHGTQILPSPRTGTTRPTPESRWSSASNGPDVDPCVIEHDGRPIGYLPAWYPDADPGVAGLDMFLVPSVRSRGLGPDAARTLATWLLGSGGMHGSPSIPIPRTSARSKVGQGRVRQEGGVRDPDEWNTHPWLLMVME
jgi:hypothetical protein